MDSRLEHFENSSQKQKKFVQVTLPILEPYLSYRFIQNEDIEK